MDTLRVDPMIVLRRLEDGKIVIEHAKLAGQVELPPQVLLRVIKQAIRESLESERV